jgi:hypothetical protein
MRNAGQSVFLSFNDFLFCIFREICIQDKPLLAVHPTPFVLLAVWPLLLIRWLYGLLSGLLPVFNHFDSRNYTADGLSGAFVVSEYILGTPMEWTSCLLGMFTYFTPRNDPRKAYLKSWDDVEKEPSDGEA